MSELKPCQFRKKPVVVEAVQWRGDNWPEVHAFYPRALRTAAGDNIAIVMTREGNIEARPGDWIIKGVEGEFYPCAPSVFDATYEPAANHRAPSPAVREFVEAHDDYDAIVDGSNSADEVAAYERITAARDRLRSEEGI